MILKQIRTGSRVKKARSKVDEIAIKRHLLLTIVRKKKNKGVFLALSDRLSGGPYKLNEILKL